MLGLKRILLIDSFIAGKRLPLMVDGHATVNGRNGSGKSSLLKLLRIFYGEEPRQVENRAGGKDSFVDWYLPRDTSLIIFEYERIDGLCCLTLYRHPTAGLAKPAYRFLKGGFSAERFSVAGTDGDFKFLRGKELRPHWQELAFPFSRQIEIVTDYRAVIQNDAALLRRSTTAAESKRLAREYCLGDGIGTMQHIEKVCTAIQNQHGNLERMKDMLADIMSREGVVIPDPPQHPENIRLSIRVRWLSEFDNELPKIRKTLHDHQEYLATERRLGAIRIALEAARGDLGARAKLLEQNREAKQAEIKKESETWQQHHFTLQETLSRFEAKANSTGSELENLHRQREEFDAQDVIAKQSEFQDVERLRGLRDQAGSRLEMLHSTQSEERRPFETKEKELHARHTRAIAELRDQKDELNASLECLAGTYREREGELSQQRENALEEKRNTQTPERERLVSELATARERAQLGIRTDAETALLEGISANLAKLRSQAKTTATECSGAADLESGAQRELEEGLKAIRKHKGHIADLEQDLDKARRLLYPEDGSWLAELRKQDPDWVRGIGRVVNPELFARKDLKADFAGPGDSVYGWDLDLSVIVAAPAADSDDELRARLTGAEEVLHIATRELETLDKYAEKKRRGLKEAAERHAHAKTGLQLLEQKVASQEALEQSEIQRVSDAVAERRIEAKCDADSLRTELAEFDARASSEIARIKEDFTRAHQGNMAAEAIERSELGARRADIDKKIADEEQTHKQANDQLWRDFDALCSRKGIDLATLSAAEEEFSAARKQVSRVEGYRSLIRDYEAWQQSQWSRREELQRHLSEQQEGIRDTEAKISSGRAQHRQRLAELERAKGRIEADWHSTRGTLSEVRQKLDEIGQIPATEQAVTDEGTPTHLVGEAESALALWKKRRREVSQGILKAENVIAGSGDEQIAETWRKSIAELETEIGHSLGDDPNYWRHIPPKLEGFVDDVLPAIRETLIQTIVGVGQQLADYFHGLKNADGSIHSYSAKISQAIVQSLDVEALSDVNIRLHSKIKDLDFWVRLESFVVEWNQWRHSDYSDLPSQELIEAMGAAIVILDKVRTGNDLRALFDLSLELRENGRLAVVKNDNDLANASSRGLSYLALCGIFIGITHYLCNNRKTHIHWPVDELEVIDGSNINRLFGMLDRAQITMVAGFPSKDANLLRLFKRHHVIDLKQGIRVMNPTDTDLLSQVRQRIAKTEAAADVR